MNPELYRIAARACADVYDKNTDIWGTQFDFSLRETDGELRQELSIAGTNELKDMISNLGLVSWGGIKLGAYVAAWRINKHIMIDPNIPLHIFGHSLGGAAAIGFKQLYGKRDNAHCVAFSPPPCLRRWTNRKMKNTTIFTDPDDAVPWLGIVNFGHPIVPTGYHIESRADHFGISIDDHKMKHWLEFVARLWT